MNANYTLSQSEFLSFAALIFKYTGIRMGERKKNLIVSRLSKRVRARNCNSYGEYLDIIKSDLNKEERNIFISLITTHVTHFFREPAHYNYLESILENRNNSPTKIWSAAASTGEEAYSAGLILQDKLGSDNWSVLGTDICNDSIQKARNGFYPIQGSEQIPEHYLKRYCLKGKEEFTGYFTFNSEIRSRIRFEVANLTTLDKLPGSFKPNIVFLRNVMIYFETKEKQMIIDKIESILSSGAILIIGHSESLTGIRSNFKLIRTSVYQKI
ncbi:CheR family methyltransferase [Leptospira johnsonii]|uniref:CheR family methyltransferase n=1 Tax=Leptospira johnsonii TaxID=1917820 RepID=UPI000D5983BE|nr:protein-glutamate O-methyltransferase CheR [Leptospira johnsonii]